MQARECVVARVVVVVVVVMQCQTAQFIDG